MQAKVKCSNCGTEISNLTMDWGRSWLWSLIFLPICFLPLIFLNRDLFLGKPDFRQDLIAKVDRVESTDAEVRVFGSVENTGDRAWSSISIEVEFYDDKGVFVQEITDYLQFDIAPGSKENIKLVLPTTEDLSAYTHKIKVVSAMDDRF